MLFYSLLFVFFSLPFLISLCWVFYQAIFMFYEKHSVVVGRKMDKIQCSGLINYSMRVLMYWW